MTEPSAPLPAASLLGQVLGHRYRLDRLIGEGGMGAVYAGCDLHTSGKVAIKVLHRELAHDYEIFNRFRAEAAMIDALQHRNITKVRDFHDPFSPHGHKDQPPYIVLEYLDGEDLRHRIRKKGKLTPEEVLPLAVQIGDALHAAHQQRIVHRDIKPANIFLVQETTATEGGKVEVVKLLDFGIAKAQRFTQGGTQARAILGTPNYMAPESIVFGSGAADEKADQWALAVTLYEALSGQQAYPGDDPFLVLADIRSGREPPFLATLVPELQKYPHILSTIARGMNREPEMRFSSVAMFVQALLGRTPEPLPLHVAENQNRRAKGQKTLAAQPDAFVEPFVKSGPESPTVHAADVNLVAAKRTAAPAQKEPHSPWAASSALSSPRGRGWKAGAGLLLLLAVAIGAWRMILWLSARPAPQGNPTVAPTSELLPDLATAPAGSERAAPEPEPSGAESPTSAQTAAVPDAGAGSTSMETQRPERKRPRPARRPTLPAGAGSVPKPDPPIAAEPAPPAAVAPTTPAPSPPPVRKEVPLIRW